jgi:hypothetical protein
VSGCKLFTPDHRLRHQPFARTNTQCLTCERDFHTATIRKAAAAKAAADISMHTDAPNPKKILRLYSYPRSPAGSIAWRQYKYQFQNIEVQNNVGNYARRLTPTTPRTKPSTTPSITHPHQRRNGKLAAAPQEDNSFLGDVPESTIEDILKNPAFYELARRTVTSGIVHDALHGQTQATTTCSAVTSS